jgi:hypothetical protein
LPRSEARKEGTPGRSSSKEGVGSHLGSNLLNLGITENARQAMTELGLDLEQFVGLEEEPGLGNGGLGRLAACYLDSLATLGYPALGYGIRYEFGIFDQILKDGWQVEVTDKWLRHANVWEIHGPSSPRLSSWPVRPSPLPTTPAIIACTGCQGGWSSAFPMILRSSVTASTLARCCGCGAPRRRSRSISRTSIVATTTEPSKKKCLRKPFRRSSIPTTNSSEASLRLEQQYDIQLAQQINVGTNSPGELIVDEKLLDQLQAGYRQLHGGIHVETPP